MKKITDYAELVKAKHALNKTIAPVEDGASMAGSYTSGKQFIREGVLYTALTTIAANTAWSSLTLDTDYELADDLTSQLASLNQTLTNKVANEIATRSKLGAHNFVSMKLSPYKAQANNYVSIGTQTDSQLTFTTENHNYADVQLAYALPIGNYKASIGEIIASDSYTPIINIYFLDGSGQNVKPTVSLTSNQTKDFEIDASVAYILISFLGTQGAATAAIRTVTFNNLMIRLATDESADYEPYSMTNREMTPYVQAISNPNLLDNPWFTVNQRGQSSYIGASVSQQYTFDRWYMSWASSDVSIAKNNDGTVTYANTSNTGNRQCSQSFEEIPISDCDCTISIDVTAFSGSDIELFYTLTSSPYTTWIRCPVTKIGINSMTAKIPDLSALSASDVKLSLKIGANCSVTFKSIKFEKGKVSTLAADTAPNYATELLKCQRYYQRINTRANVTFGLALAVSATIAIMPITINTMRALPSVGEDVTGMSLKTADDATSNAITAINGFLEGDVAHGVLTFTSTSLVVGTIYKVEFANTTSYIDFSSDL